MDQLKTARENVASKRALQVELAGEDLEHVTAHLAILDRGVEKRVLREAADSLPSSTSSQSSVEPESQSAESLASPGPRPRVTSMMNQPF